MSPILRQFLLFGLSFLFVEIGGIRGLFCLDKFFREGGTTEGTEDTGGGDDFKL